MNFFKFEAFLKEFPFLKSILEEMGKDHLSITSIHVGRVDENLLKRVLEYSYFDGSMGVSEHEEQLWVVHDDVVAYRLETQDKTTIGSNYAHSKSESRDGEPILEALIDHEDLKYLILFEKTLDNWEGSRTVDDFRITIYKPSRHSSIDEEIEEARRQALADVKAEANF